MYKDDVVIQLHELSFDLWYVDEKGKQLRCLFEMDSTRDFGMLVTKHYDYIDGEFKCVGSIGEQVTKDVCKEDWRGDLIIWALKGMWGIPVRYGKKET